MDPHQATRSLLGTIVSLVVLGAIAFFAIRHDEEKTGVVAKAADSVSSTRTGRTKSSAFPPPVVTQPEAPPAVTNSTAEPTTTTNLLADPLLARVAASISSYNALILQSRLPNRTSSTSPKAPARAGNSPPARSSASSQLNGRIDLAYASMGQAVAELARRTPKRREQERYTFELADYLRELGLPGSGVLITTNNAPDFLRPLVAANAETEAEKARQRMESTTVVNASKTAEVDARVVAFLRKRAESGNADALYDLALRHLEGRGVESNRTEAVRMLKDAASLNQQQAIQRLKLLDASP